MYHVVTCILLDHCSTSKLSSNCIHHYYPASFYFWYVRLLKWTLVLFVDGSRIIGDSFDICIGIGISISISIVRLTEVISSASAIYER